MEELRYQVDLLSAMNQKLTSDEKMYRLICDMSSNAFLYVNYVENQVKTLANWSFFFPDVEIRDIKDLTKLYSQADEKYVLPFRDLLFLEKTKMDTDSGFIKLKDGKTWVECETSVLYDGEGNATDKAVRFKDISRFKNQNDELTYMAYYDMLTGLYNRNYFVRLLTDYVHKAEKENAVVSVMFFDLNDFSKNNGGLGLIAGDEAVQQFGRFLSSFQGENVLVSHFNTDIFCIAIYDPCGNRSVEHICRAIHERVETPFVLSTGQELILSVSVGVAEYPEAAENVLELINCAEIVMFKARGLGKNAVRYFDAPVLNEFLRNINIENKLKEAVSGQNFEINFQPQYYIKEQKLRGLEALIRWRDDDGRMISPAVFIPIAEKNGAIVSIGTWVLEESVRIFADWKNKFGRSMILSLNISAIQYMRDEFIDDILGMVKKYAVEPKELELEITESMLIGDFRTITEKICILRDYGIRISLDNFGTGYSSLSYLKGLPIDTLKIDKCFVDTCAADENTRIITESVMAMAGRLGFQTVAEGVETKEQFEYFEGIGCDCIQGYLLGKPMPKEEVEQLLLGQI